MTKAKNKPFLRFLGGLCLAAVFGFGFYIKGQEEKADQCEGRGEMCYTLRGYPQAIESYEKAIRIRKKLVGKNNRIRMGFIYDKLSRTYAKTGKYKDALKNSKEAVRILSKSLGDHEWTAVAYHNLGLAYHNLGLVYQEMGSYQEAMNAYQESMRISKAIGQSSSSADYLLTQGMLEDVRELLAEEQSDDIAPFHDCD